MVTATICQRRGRSPYYLLSMGPFYCEHEHVFPCAISFVDIVVVILLISTLRFYLTVKTPTEYFFTDKGGTGCACREPVQLQSLVKSEPLLQGIKYKFRWWPAPLDLSLSVSRDLYYTLCINCYTLTSLGILIYIHNIWPEIKAENGPCTINRKTKYSVRSKRNRKTQQRCQG